jgi:hypothetical protein
MVFLKTAVSAAAITMFIATGALVATTGAASARMVCNNTGDCWHTDANDTYPGTGYVNHDDDWYFHQRWDGNTHYRETHEGRGYYKSGIWIGL